MSSPFHLLPLSNASVFPHAFVRLVQHEKLYILHPPHFYTSLHTPSPFIHASCTLPTSSLLKLLLEMENTKATFLDNHHAIVIEAKDKSNVVLRLQIAVKRMDNGIEEWKRLIGDLCAAVVGLENIATAAAHGDFGKQVGDDWQHIVRKGLVWADKAGAVRREIRDKRERRRQREIGWRKEVGRRVREGRKTTRKSLWQEDVQENIQTQDRDEETDTHAQPGKSVKPEQPRESIKPEQPRESVKPEQPRESVKPEQPRESVKPEQPRESVKPEQPKKSVNPQQPVKPEERQNNQKDASSNVVQTRRKKKKRRLV